VIENAVPPAPEVLVDGAGRAAKRPARRIFGIDRRCRAHLPEMEGEGRDPPAIIRAPAAAAAPKGGETPCPVRTDNLHFDGGIAAAMRSGGHDVPVAVRSREVFDSAVGLACTDADLAPRRATIARSVGRSPWRVPAMR